MACGAGVILLVGMGMAWASGDERLTYSIALSLGVTVIFSGIIGAAVDRVIRAIDGNALTIESINSRLGWLETYVASHRGNGVQRPGKIPDTGEIPPEVYAKAFVDLVHQQQRADDGPPTSLHSVRPPWRSGQTR